MKKSFRSGLVLCLLICFGTDSFSQKEDYIWLFGSSSIRAYLENGDLDTTWGATNINFNFDPPRIEFDPVRELDFSATNTSVCDKEGRLMCYSNGMQINSGVDHSILEDTIAYCLYWKDRTYYTEEEKLVALGFTFPDMAIILPEPGVEKSYFLFYEDWDISPPSINDFDTKHVFWAKITKDSEVDQLKVIFKDSLLLGDTLSIGGLAASRHANGRDWWLLFPSKFHNKIYTYLVDPTGVHLKVIQKFDENWPHGIGQAKFSPNGSILCFNRGRSLGKDGTKVFIFEFDRCTGTLSNPISEFISGEQGVSRGVAYSIDSRYLYISNDQWIYQYDLFSDSILLSRKTVATYDGYGYFYPGSLDSTFTFATLLGFMCNGPDGRIYISAGSGSNRKMGVIQYPNEIGEACDVQQHSLHITTSYARTMPTFPNYRLGPLDGSNCDTLGLNNDPIAKYRYEQDTIDYLKVRFTDLSYFRPESWHWDFGDGATSTERYPYHTFPSNGTYEVCLTVSNENSSNTVCRTLTFGTASTSEPEGKEIEVNLYPNPVKDDLTLTIYDYLPQKGTVHFFDTKGQLILTQKVYNGWNTIDMSRLISGTYVYQIMDGRVVVKSGKVVKVE